MLTIQILCVGKMSQKWFQSGADEYKKRLNGYCKFNLIELNEFRLPDSPSPAEIAAALNKEAIQICEKMPKNAWFCVFTLEGKLLSSEQLADKIANIKISGKSNLCFLIGSSYGISETLKSKADFKLSMSPMTFPHHLARIMVLEQLYRAEAIQAGSKYHK